MDIRKELGDRKKLIDSWLEDAIPGVDPYAKLLGTDNYRPGFGKGKVLNIDGIGQDKKAEINFENGGVKKLLLRLAKLKLLS